MIVIHKECCDGCGACIEVCPTGALYLVDGKATVDGTLCHDCEACIAACPTEAIALVTPQPELAVEPIRGPAPQPEPEVLQVRMPSAPVPLRARVLPVVSATLAWAGREIVPRLADFWLDSLDRREARQQTPGAGAGTARGTVREGKGGARRQRRRRRGGRRSRQR